MRRPRVSGEVSFFLHIHAKKMRLTSTPSHFVTAPGGISALSGPVVFDDCDYVTKKMRLILLPPVI